MSCLDSKKNKKIKDISAACRESIDYIIKGLRENLTFPLVCPLSGVVIKTSKMSILTTMTWILRM